MYAYLVYTFKLGKCILQTQINLPQFDRQVISYLSYNSEITDSIYIAVQLDGEILFIDFFFVIKPA